MAEPTGFEPAISGVTGRRVKPGYTTAPRLLIYGGRNRARTCDPLLVRQVLSQLSYSPNAFNLKASLSIQHPTERVKTHNYTVNGVLLQISPVVFV
jgi:hypothetical protein